MKDDEQVDLLSIDNQLCFALYAATRAITRAYAEHLTPLGLTYPQYLVLLALWEGDGCTVGDIGNRLMLDSGTVTPVVKRLEGMDLVQRSRDENDERVVRVFLKQKGRNLKKPIWAIRNQIGCDLEMEQDYFRRFRREIMQVVETLDKVKQKQRT